jgi:opacity protein-like surface antigen
MLRTRTLLVATLAFGAAPAAAQSGITLVGGFVSANISFEEDGETDDESFDSRTGFAIGLGLQRQIGQSLSFAPEALYVIKGTQEPDGGDVKLKLGYIEVPLLFRYNFGSGGQAAPFVTAGPTVAFQVSCNLTSDDDSVSCDDVYDEGEGWESIDFGVMVGAGVMFNRFGLSARYEMGLKDIQEAEFVESKNTALMLLASFAF